ncbi:glycosyltransferase family 4 protein [Patescibacteria group bacterium]|nr:glycosyltransferase family 4 protein [Patescibacteria group bacterium]
MCRILYLNHNVKGRSTYHRCFSLAKELVLLGHEVTILTNSPTNRIRYHQYTEDKVKIVETPDLLWGSLRTGWDPLNVIRRCAYLKDKQYDLIHAFDTRPTVIIPALFYKKFKKNIPLVIDWSDWWGKGGAITLRPNKVLNALFSPIETFFEEYFRKFADYTTVASSLLQKRAIKLGIKVDKIVILPNGADIRNIFPSDKTKARKALNLPLDKNICIFPGFVLYDIQMVIDSFVYLHSRNPDSILILVGKFSKKVLRLYQAYVNTGDILIRENVPKKTLRLYLNSADVGLLPMADNLTNKARFPMKFGDYLATGIPVVTNKVGDVGNLVQKYKIGFLSQYSPKSIGDTILEIFRNPGKARKISTRGRLFAEKEFSWEFIARSVKSIYQSL